MTAANRTKAHLNALGSWRIEPGEVANMSKLRILVITTFCLGLFALPTLALAARGYATTDVNMRAGPGTGYPIVTTIPARGPVNIHGCLSNRSWCDVTWDGHRGWVSARYLEYFYRDRYVYLPQHFGTVGVPIITFEFGPYWDNYYRGRRWYGRRDYWRDYQRHHGGSRYYRRAPSRRAPSQSSAPRSSGGMFRAPSRSAPSRSAPSKSSPPSSGGSKGGGLFRSQ